MPMPTLHQKINEYLKRQGTSVWNLALGRMIEQAKLPHNLTFVTTEKWGKINENYKTKKQGFDFYKKSSNQYFVFVTDKF